MQDDSALKPSFRGASAPSTYLTNAEQFNQAKAIDAKYESSSFADAMGIAVENEWAIPSAERLIERDKTFETDVNFSTDHAKLSEEFGQEFDIDTQSYIANSHSQDELNARVRWAREDIERHRALSDHGIKGTVATLTAAIFDPVGILAGAFTGGASWVTKGNTVRRALKTGGVVSAESAAFESLIVASDTQKQSEDILFAAGGGFVLGAMLSPLMRANDPSFAKITDETDDVINSTVNKELQRSHSRETNEAASVLDPTEIDIEGTKVRLNKAKVNQTIEAHIEDLTSKSRSGITFKDGRAQAQVTIKGLKENVSELIKKGKDHKARVAASLGAPRNATEASNYQYRFEQIAKLYEPKIKSAEERISGIERQLNATAEAKSARKELEAFKGKTRVEQINQLFKGNAPRLSDDIKKQKAAVASSVPPKSVKEPEIDSKEASDDNGGSVGAARTDKLKVVDFPFELSDSLDNQIEDIIDSIDHLPEPINIKTGKDSGFADALYSAFTTLDNSLNQAFRGLAHKLLENPQGNALPDDTASIKSFIFDKQINSAVKNRYNEGYEEWSVSEGRNIASAYLDVKNFKPKFDNQVYAKITNPDLEVHPAIAKAADGLREGFAKALEIRKAKGELGFEHVKSDSRYIPRIMDGAKMDTAVNKYNKATVLATLSQGYQTGGIKLSQKNADTLAEMQYNRTMSSTLSARHAFEDVVSVAERERFLKELETAGVPKEVLEDFVAEKELAELTDSVSSRAKFGVYINPEAEVNGLKVQELLNTNVAELSQNYFKEAAGGAALATKGIKSYSHGMSLIDAAEQVGRNSGLSKERMATEAQMLRDTVTMMYGKSTEADPTSLAVVGARRVREYTGIIRLGQVGFAQMGEIGRAMAHLGLGTVLKNVPVASLFKSRRGIRAGGKSSGDSIEPELREIEEQLGYVGEDNWLTPVSVRHEDLGEVGEAGAVGRIFDNMTAAGGRVNAIASGFQAIQGGSEKLVMRGIKQNLIKMAEGDNRFSRQLLTESGLTDEFIDEFSEFIRKNPKSEKFNGKDIRLMNFEAMSPQMRETLVIAMQRMSGRMIQRNFIGDTSPWMNKWVGKSLTQFKSFSLVSMEKQLIHDLRGDKIKAAQILMFSSLMSYMAYSSQHLLRSLGEDDPEAYLAEAFDERNVAFGVFNKLPQTASVSLAGDALATFGALPDELYSTGGRMGFRPMNTGNVAPALGTIQGGVDLVGSLVNTLSGEGETKDTAEKLRKLIPLGNTIGVGSVLQAANNQL